MKKFAKLRGREMISWDFTSDKSIRSYPFPAVIAHIKLSNNFDKRHTFMLQNSEKLSGGLLPPSPFKMLKHSVARDRIKTMIWEWKLLNICNNPRIIRIEQRQSLPRKVGPNYPKPVPDQRHEIPANTAADIENTSTLREPLSYRSDIVRTFPEIGSQRVLLIPDLSHGFYG